MGCGISTQKSVRERTVSPPKFHVDYLQTMIDEIYNNEIFYRSIYNEEILVPFRRLKSFFEDNESIVKKTKTTKSLPRTVQHDAKEVIKLYPIFNKSKELYGKVRFQFFTELDRFFTPLLENHRFKGLCDVNTKNYSIDLLSCGIFNHTDFKYHIDKLSTPLGRSRLGSRIGNNDLESKQKMVNIAAHMLWYAYMINKEEEIKKAFVFKLEDSFPDHIKNKKVQEILVVIKKCKKCRSSYYEPKRTIKRKKKTVSRSSSLEESIKSPLARVITVNPIYDGNDNDSTKDEVELVVKDF